MPKVQPSVEPTLSGAADGEKQVKVLPEKVPPAWGTNNKFKTPGDQNTSYREINRKGPDIGQTQK